MKKRFLIAAAFFALFGCATPVTHRQVVLEKNVPGQEIMCNGNKNSWADCYNKAAEVCPEGYGVVDKVESGRNVIIPSAAGLVGTTIAQRLLLVTCKVPDIWPDEVPLKFAPPAKKAE